MIPPAAPHSRDEHVPRHLVAARADRVAVAEPHEPALALEEARELARRPPSSRRSPRARARARALRPLRPRRRATRPSPGGTPSRRGARTGAARGRRRPGLRRQQLGERQPGSSGDASARCAQPLLDDAAVSSSQRVRERPVALDPDRSRPSSSSPVEQARAASASTRTGLVDERAHDRGRVAPLEQLHRARRSSAPRRRRVEHDAAADRRLAAQDDAVAARRDDRRRRAAAARSLARRARRAPGSGSCRGGRTSRAPSAIGSSSSSATSSRYEPGNAPGATSASPRRTSPRSTPGEADGDPLARLGPLDGRVVHLHAPHPHVAPGRLEARARRPRRSTPTTASP